MAYLFAFDGVLCDSYVPIHWRNVATYLPHYVAL